MDNVKITFGMIVLNGEPFVRYNLRSIYPFAHEIIVVEGACPAASNVARSDGHSRDGTLERLRQFLEFEDPECKMQIVTAEIEGHANGFWPEKDEMSQAYANRATGNYLWQVDSDEFYKTEDINSVIKMLTENPSISEISFRTITFWGGLNFKVDGILLRLGDQDFHRLFSWKKGYKYLTHRPPTVVNEQGVNLLNQNSIPAKKLAKIGIFLYHYEYLFPIQVYNKANYYANAPHCKGLRPSRIWVDDCYMNLSKPFRVHNIHRWLSWLEPYSGTHPPIVVNMLSDVEAKKFVEITIRGELDIEKLAISRLYRIKIIMLKISIPFIKMYFNFRSILRNFAIKLGLWSHIKSIKQKFYSMD